LRSSKAFWERLIATSNDLRSGPAKSLHGYPHQHMHMLH
jgi:hypothetical protein